MGFQKLDGHQGDTPRGLQNLEAGLMQESQRGFQKLEGDQWDTFGGLHNLEAGPMRNSQGIAKTGGSQGMPPLALKIWRRDRCGTSRGFQTFEGHQGNPRDTLVRLQTLEAGLMQDSQGVTKTGWGPWDTPACRGLQNLEASRMRESQGLTKTGEAQGIPPLTWKIWRWDRCGTGIGFQILSGGTKGIQGIPLWDCKVWRRG